MADAAHATVLREEAVHYLNLKPGAAYIDATLGAGGHSVAMMEKEASCQILGIDRDEEALAIAGERLAGYKGNTHLACGNYSDMPAFVDDLGWAGVDGVLMDLGVSSMQLDRSERGFSYRFEGPLDMRMDRNAGLTASQVVNGLTESELAEIFKAYGEEPRNRRIAKAIVRHRAERPFESTSELSEVIRKASGERGPRRKAEGRCFQALRIFVNDELSHLEDALEAALEVLKPGGRLVVISFHSLEDRMVKQFFRDEARDCICPPDFPVCRCEQQPRLKIITRKPVVPGAAELAANKRSHSAKMRVAEKI